MKSMAMAAAALASATVGDDPVRGSSITVPFRGGVTIPVTVDATLVVSTEAHEADAYPLLGPLMTMVDTFESSTTAGPRCAGGKESWVRVIDIAAKREVFQQHVESCIKGLRVAEPVLSFAGDRRAFTIHRIGLPDITVVLDPDAGTAKVS